MAGAGFPPASRTLSGLVCSISGHAQPFPSSLASDRRNPKSLLGTAVTTGDCGLLVWAAPPARDAPGAAGWAGCLIPHLLEHTRPWRCGWRALALGGDRVAPCSPGRGCGRASSVSPQLGLPKAEVQLQRVVLGDQLVSSRPAPCGGPGPGGVQGGSQGPTRHDDAQPWPASPWVPDMYRRPHASRAWAALGGPCGAP